MVLRRLPAHVQREDLASAGALALVQAARSFDPDRGVPFTNYAAMRIRGAIIDELRSADWMTRGARQKTRAVREFEDMLTPILGRCPTDAEIADASGTEIETVRSIRSLPESQMVSIEANAGLAATLADSTASPEERVLVNEKLRVLTVAVNELPEKLRVVIQGVFFEGRPVADIASELGVTESRISQLRTQALGLLREAMDAVFEPMRTPKRPEKPGVALRRRYSYIDAVVDRAATG
jgi:RNA polymerase sigma factor for flagellar operon FliA